ncbi:MAG: hypothetical protein EBY21_13145, partial [Alphaproteobacteria bacterium]|nr:hypothetical protein [Alphaproteobacteria bacterium]
EFLGTSDKAIVAMRRLMLEATRDVEQGRRPRGSDPRSSSQIRPYDNVVDNSANWRILFEPELRAKW